MSSSVKSQLRGRTWTKGRYLISTDPSLISIPRLTEIFASVSFHWANPIPAEAMREALENSLPFGLYELNSADISGSSDRSPSDIYLVGIARCVTDFTASSLE
ncbi:GNAT family N-acetyltransferase [Verticillium dahliae]